MVGRLPRADYGKPNILHVVILSIVVVVFLLVILGLTAYICRHRRRYAAGAAAVRNVGGNPSMSRSGLSSSSANSNVMYMQKFPLGASAVGSHNSSGLAHFHQLKVKTSPLPVRRGSARRPPWAASSSSAASGESGASTDSPARGGGSSEVGGGGGSGSEQSYASRSNNKLEAVNHSNSNHLQPLPMIGEVNPESVLLSSTAYQQFTSAPSQGSTPASRGQSGEVFLHKTTFVLQYFLNI